jgi:hypothetical protein
VARALEAVRRHARTLTRSGARQVPHLQPHPGTHSVVVLDNFVTHHSYEFLAMMEAQGAFVVHLPPYSPDLNPIELVFAQIKAWLRANHQYVDTVRTRAQRRASKGGEAWDTGAAGGGTDHTPRRLHPPQVPPMVAIHEACLSVTRDDCRGYIERACRAHGWFYTQ